MQSAVDPVGQLSRFFFLDELKELGGWKSRVMVDRNSNGLAGR